jgi:uncharacterized protein YdiU (UPF0061 family)
MFPVRLKFLFSYVTPRTPSSPRLIHFTEEVAEILGITREEAQSAEFTNILWKRVASNTRPYSMSYAGHQFGNWAGQLGDGRAIILTEVRSNRKHIPSNLKELGNTIFPWS